MPESLFAAIEASGPAAALRTSFVAYPLVNAAHILCAGGLVTLVWLMHAALAGDRRLSAGAVLLRRLVVAALALLALTGLALFSVKAADYAANPAFRIKMALIGLALANVAIYYAMDSKRLVSRRISVLVSVALWPSVLVAGRFIGFV